MRGDARARGASRPAKTLLAALGYVDEDVDAGWRLTDPEPLETEQGHDMSGVDGDGGSQ